MNTTATCTVIVTFEGFKAYVEGDEPIDASHVVCVLPPECRAKITQWRSSITDEPATMLIDRIARLRNLASFCEEMDAINRLEARFFKRGHEMEADYRGTSLTIEGTAAYLAANGITANVI